MLLPGANVLLPGANVLLALGFALGLLWPCRLPEIPEVVARAAIDMAFLVATRRGHQSEIQVLQ